MDQLSKNVVNQARPQAIGGPSNIMFHITMTSQWGR